MDNLMLNGLARQQTLRLAMDIAANNIANASTNGFKAERVMLEASTSHDARHSDGPDRISFVSQWALGRDFSQGVLERTARPLDMALDGEGFFALETDNGERFTRDGAFSLSSEGGLIASDGARVLDDAGRPIFVDRAAGPITVSETGVISQNGAEVARIGVVRFEAPGLLTKTGFNRFEAAADAERAQDDLPRVRQGHIEGSNVRAINEITTMMEVSRTYASVSKMIRDADELSRKAIDRLGRP